MGVKVEHDVIGLIELLQPGVPGIMGDSAEVGQVEQAGKAAIDGIIDRAGAFSSGQQDGFKERRRGSRVYILLKETAIPGPEVGPPVAFTRRATGR
jgi:hypothetical protein